MTTKDLYARKEVTDKKMTTALQLVKIHQHIQQSLTKGQKCISRESNTGPIDGNDGFYH